MFGRSCGWMRPQRPERPRPLDRWDFMRKVASVRIGPGARPTTAVTPELEQEQRGRAVGTAHAPPAPSFQTGRPSFFALSARLPWMPVPGNTMTPIGCTSSIAS